jgi:SAM-dependent methyltransferase
MAPSLRPVAERVVARARLLPGERVIDLGTGTGTAAALAAGDGRRVVGLDAAPGMLELARQSVPPDVDLVEASFDAVPVADETFDVALAVHALLFADDPIATLAEWRRIAASGGRLSLSVPGPGAVVPNAVLGPVYERHGIDRSVDYPTLDELAAWAASAQWSEIEVDADPTIAIVLDDADAFRTWLTVGARGRATAGWDPSRREALAADLMDASPRDSDGRFRLPFGSLYLTAVKDAR